MGHLYHGYVSHNQRAIFFHGYIIDLNGCSSVAIHRRSTRATRLPTLRKGWNLGGDTWNCWSSEARRKAGKSRWRLNGHWKMVPSGNLTKSYWKWPLIVDFPIQNGDFHSYVSLPEGIRYGKSSKRGNVLVEHSGYFCWSLRQIIGFGVPAGGKSHRSNPFPSCPACRGSINWNHTADQKKDDVLWEFIMSSIRILSWLDDNWWPSPKNWHRHGAAAVSLESLEVTVTGHVPRRNRRHTLVF